MATNEILPFASTDTGTNLLSQSEYSSDSQRLIGNQPGLGRAKLVNKALRQSSLISAGLAEFLADNQSNNITDGLTTQNISDYMTAAVQAAAGLSSVVTPPQFDNDASIATTEFVQRALGNIRGLSAYNVNTTLSEADIGKLIVPVLNNITLNLPAPSTLPLGTKLYFYGNDKTGIIVSGNGTSFTFGSSGNIPSLSLGSNDTLELTNVGAWMVTGGTAFLAASSSFSSTLGVNGSISTPKFTIKTGQITANVSSTSTWLSSNVVYATSFNTATMGIIVLERSNTSSAPLIGLNNIATGDWTASGFKLWVFDAGQTGTVYLNYIAIGY